MKKGKTIEIPNVALREEWLAARLELGASVGTDRATHIRETPGMSAFALEKGIVYLTYSAYARGFDGLWGLCQWRDRTPRGRNEAGFWIRRRDEYGKR